MWLTIVGVITQMSGALLTVVYRHPALGHGLMQESYDPKRNKVGSIIGIVLIVVGAGVAIAGAIVQEQG
jgi:hypothetical protein